MNLQESIRKILREESERDNLWRFLVLNISSQSVYIDRLLNDLKLNKIVNTTETVQKTKTFLINKLKEKYFNKITSDGSGGSEFANEVAQFILNQTSSILNKINPILLSTINEKDIDNNIKNVDFDYIFDEISKVFNYGNYITSDNFEPYIDKGGKFDTEFYNTLMKLTPIIKSNIIKLIKNKL